MSKNKEKKKENKKLTVELRVNKDFSEEERLENLFDFFDFLLGKGVEENKEEKVLLRSKKHELLDNVSIANN